MITRLASLTITSPLFEVITNQLYEFITNPLYEMITNPLNETNKSISSAQSISFLFILFLTLFTMHWNKVRSFSLILSSSSIAPRQMKSLMKLEWFVAVWGFPNRWVTACPMHYHTCLMLCYDELIVVFPPNTQTFSYSNLTEFYLLKLLFFYGIKAISILLITFEKGS